jgi:cellulose biosynthesis protein BcsQ
MAKSIPILTLAALKGGVGKTTLSANLAAFFALDRAKRVLLIDLDFQGSLSSMLLPAAQRIPSAAHCRAAMAVGRMMSVDQFIAALPVPLVELGDTKAIPAHYDLAQTENNRLVYWLLEHAEDDIRYTLSTYLLSERVQSAFDLIIIDAPPRLTTAAVQSFCTSTHVLIPTILDRLSGEAVSSFVGQLLDIKEKLAPHMKVLGVVGSMTRWNVGKWMEEHPGSEPDGALIIAEREGYQAIDAALDRLRVERALPAAPARILPYDTFIADSASVAEQAGERIAYPELAAPEKNMFRRLGREVSRVIFPQEVL